MYFGTKIEDCCETVIAAMASHIDRMGIELEMKEQANRRLGEENAALRNDLDDLRARYDALDKTLARVKEFCANQSAEAKTEADSFEKKDPLYTFRSRPAEFIGGRSIKIDSDVDPFNGTRFI